jgi:hypothetical protein
MVESPVAPTAPTTQCLTMQQLTTTSISIYTNVIPRRMAMTDWRMCARAVMAPTMLVLSRVAGTNIIIITMTTRCHHSRHSLVPSPGPLAAVAVRHPLSNNNSNSNNSNSHPDQCHPLAGLSVLASPTEARLPVTMAQGEEAVCSPGPRGRAKNLHQYDRRFLILSVFVTPLVVSPFSLSFSFCLLV